MIYVVQYPRSNTNHSGKYRVVAFSEWMDYCDDKMTGSLPVYAEVDSFEEAVTIRDRMNDDTPGDAEARILRNVGLLD